MFVLAVDLAAKFSAVNVQDDSGKVYLEFDSSGLSAFQLGRRILEAVEDYKVDLILIEDVPYGISSQAMVKPVLRLQGILITILHRYLDRVVFVNPSTWQKTYPGVARGKSEDRVEAARQAALALGYSPPDLVAQHIASLPEGAKVLKKHTNPLAKSMTDYIDAFLMVRWAFTFETQEEFLAQSGVQPVFI